MDLISSDDQSSQLRHIRSSSNCMFLPFDHRMQMLKPQLVLRKRKPGGTISRDMFGNVALGVHFAEKSERQFLETPLSAHLKYL